MAVDAAHVEVTTAALLADVKAVFGKDAAAEWVVEANAVAILEFVDEDDWFTLKLVDDVQQFFHDRFIDTTWPACPEHANHPLELTVGPPIAWRCPRSNRPLCALGELHTVFKSDGRSALRSRTALADERRRIEQFMKEWSGWPRPDGPARRLGSA
jgi:hypothetical protein